MPKARPLLLFFIFIFCFSWLSTPGIWKTTKAGLNHDHSEEKVWSKKISEKILSSATHAKQFAKQNGFNSKTSFLIDMSISSGQNRFFIYDMEKDSILGSGLVTHGRCNEDWLEGRKYSNVPGSGCTSLGKYKVGNPYHGSFGLAFKLHGLDNTNSNAFKRYIVLHSHECVPQYPVEGEICRSDGCPTVSPNFLKELKPVISQASKPILLWIYE